MARIITTALSAVTIVALGIVALQFRVNSIDSTQLNNSSADAFNLATNVTGDAGAIVGNAVPLLFVAVFIALIGVIVLLSPR